MASDPIETAPKNEEWIALLGESGDVFEIARWSVEKGNWVGREGEPIRITPTHWFRPDPSWLSAIYTSPQGKKATRRKRFGLYAGLLIVAWSAMLEVPWFVGLPTRENFVKIFSTEASVAPQTVASQHVAGEEMANLYVRTATESPAGIENTYVQDSAKPSSSKPKQGPEQLHLKADAIVGDPAHAGEQVEAVTGQITQAAPAGDAASTGQEQALRQERRRIDALARDVVALREEIEAIETRLAAASAAPIEAAQSVQAAQPSATEEKPVVEPERHRADSLVRPAELAPEPDQARQVVYDAAHVTPVIVVRPTDPTPHARPDKASRTPADMVAQTPRERMAARSDPGEAWPRASNRSTPEAPIECLPAALRTVLTDLEKRFGPVTIVSTTQLHTDNHSPASTRANLHSACKAVDIRTSREPKEVSAYLRSRPEVGGVNTYRNRVVHFDLNTNYKLEASKPDR